MTPSTKQTLTITGIVLVLLAVFLYPYIHTTYTTAKTIKQETATQTDILIKNIDQTTDQLPEVFTKTNDETERRITNAHNTIQEETRTHTIRNTSHTCIKRCKQHQGHPTE